MNHPYLPEGLRYGTAENREYLSSVPALERAMREGTILEAPALVCDSDLTLHVDLGCMRGYIPREEALWCREGESIKDIAILTRVGKPVCFVVTGFRELGGERIAMLSRRLAQAQCAAHFFDTAREGDLIRARVTHLEPYGAFVDVGCGVPSLLSVDSISVSRISHPSDRLSVGDSVWTVVKAIDRAQDRIFVSMRELLGTWEENAALFSAGQTVPGIVRSIESYGIFVELTPNLTGLAELKEGVCVNQSAAVYVKSILPDRMKIKLVILDSFAGSMGEKTVAPTLVTPDHIDYWRYSPLGASKLVETVFR
jgi:small subunit ribosomal protein S1